MATKASSIVLGNGSSPSNASKPGRRRIAGSQGLLQGGVWRCPRSHHLYPTGMCSLSAWQLSSCTLPTSPACFSSLSHPWCSPHLAKIQVIVRALRRNSNSLGYPECSQVFFNVTKTRRGLQSFPSDEEWLMKPRNVFFLRSDLFSLVTSDRT